MGESVDVQMDGWKYGFGRDLAVRRTDNNAGWRVADSRRADGLMVDHQAYEQTCGQAIAAAGRLRAGRRTIRRVGGLSVRRADRFVYWWAGVGAGVETNGQTWALGRRVGRRVGVTSAILPLTCRSITRRTSRSCDET